MLKKFSVGQKIFSAFILVFLIFGAVGLESFTALRTSSKGFEDYRNFAIESIYVSNIQAELLKTQTTVKDFIITGDSQYQRQYRRSMDNLVATIGEATKTISSPERLSLVNDIKLSLHKYESLFQDLSTIQKQFNEISELVIEQGEIMSHELESLTNKGRLSSNKDFITLVAKAMDSLYTARLNAAKFYRSNNESQLSIVSDNLENLSKITEKMHSGASEKLLDALTQISDALNEYQKTFKKSAQLITKRNKDIKTNIASLEPYMLESASKALTSITRDQKELGPALQDNNSRAIINVCITAFIALLLGLASVFIIGRDITRPLQNMVNVLNKIATGDLSVSIENDGRKDELGALADSFTIMINSLKKMAVNMDRIADSDLTVDVAIRSENDSVGKAMNKMIENLKSVHIRLHEAIQTLSSSISQISAATTELTASSAETASAVAETNATVEEVKQTAHLSNEKSRQVADVAKSAVKTSQEGQRATQAAAAGMKDIRKQMDTIAQSIVQLSEQSQHIGDIVYVVNDLADQSNILAVNASIEASKAGEEGKGFTVVAREIRNLADQSKQSVAQIQSILADIQKATSTAVMITEEGGKAVESGAQKSSIAGESIIKLSAVVTQSAQSSTQIVASSQEQLAGLDQVAVALGSIKQAGEQNLESSRQLEEAIRELDNQAKSLNSMMDNFKI
ncbi:methyl-accepting chemotaxis protein [Maridesulfovibrio bastinii]|uniref:methyl-accepting chemotaxis protein n=1 Tax=Maridesulfovibrio bastinii TaxID=47157 RepID=UPI0003FC8ED4|nr:methyl-accepting chemotaxis protein [Maridesulfovibrio bastinii]